MVFPFNFFIFSILSILILSNPTIGICQDDLKIKDEKAENKSIQKIPEKIESDLVLKQSKFPYVTNGFTLLRGAVLTIEPGVKILPEDTKDKPKPIIIEGQLICGTKTGTNIEWQAPTTIEFSGTKIELFRTHLKSSNLSINGGTEGIFENCIIERYFTRRTLQPIEITIPKRHEIKFSKCHFINHSIDLPENINEVRDKIQFEYCAFSPVWDSKINKYLPVAIDCNIFLVGNKCDLHTFIKWQNMNYTFEPSFQTNWYIKDSTMKSQLDSAISKIVGFKVNYSSPYTNFKPELPPVEKKPIK